jgi:hypothetical protein
MIICRSVKREFEQALAQNRQPNCLYCSKPLEVEQVQTESIRWIWSKTHMRYEKFEEGSAADPCCVNCGNSDRDFISPLSEVDDLCKRLGLDF